jgi:hypothetical protein
LPLLAQATTNLVQRRLTSSLPCRPGIFSSTIKENPKRKRGQKLGGRKEKNNVFIEIKEIANRIDVKFQFLHFVFLVV